MHPPHSFVGDKKLHICIGISNLYIIRLRISRGGF